MMELKQQLERLYAEQLEEWTEFNERRALMMSHEQRSLSGGGLAVAVKVRNNPARMLSTTARVTMVRGQQDTSPRHCMLCPDNRPRQQRAVSWCGRRAMQVLVNPYPIVDRHFTIAAAVHQPQRFDADTIADMLTLAAQLPGYAVSYNGPRCGASIPWHLHLQAFPVDDTLLNGLSLDDEVCDGVVRRDVLPLPVKLYRGVEPTRVAAEFVDATGGDETMLNAVAWSDGEAAPVLAVIERTHHRPANFGDGDGQMLWSPGILDLLGIITLPREHDFTTITAEVAAAVYRYISQ